MKTKNPFDEGVREYDQWFDDPPKTFLSELAAFRQFVPAQGKGIEIGVGTGRFANELGIKHGLEPSEKMAQFAKSRGIEVEIGVAEDLPYEDDSFDFVIMVAVDTFVQDIRKTYSEVSRILKPGGKLIVGTLHKMGAVAQKYMSMTDSEVYKNAEFHTVEETKDQLSAAGFSGLKTCQILFDMHPDQIEVPIPGYDKGSFVAIEAVKE